MFTGGDMPTHTASTIVAEGVSGSHVLTVQGYSHTVGHGVGKYIRSDSFSVGGHTWDMAYYPDGYFRQAVSPRISIALFLRHTDATSVKISYRFSILDQLGKPVPGCTTQYRTLTCALQGGIYGTLAGGLIERDELEKSAYLKDDCFSAKCELTVINIRTKDVMAPPSDMHEQLGRILETGKVADVAFEVAGETFSAHWCLLAARSSVFMAQFLSLKAENATTSWSSVSINDMEAGVFKAMLHFIYTDSLPKIDDDDDETPKMLFAAADRYDLQKLKLICENMLCSGVGTSTVITGLTFAEEHGCVELKKACFQFLASSENLQMAIVGTTDAAFENLKTTQPNILEELVANVEDTPPDMLISGGEGASSTIVAECVSGSHVLTVNGYSNTVTLGRGIPSGMFSVGGHTWKLVYYPDGHNASCGDYISVFLLLHHPTDDATATDVNVRCRFSLLDQVGEPVPEYTTTAQGYTNTTECPRFIKRVELENSNYLKDDCFSIRCDVSVTKVISTQTTTQLVTVPPPGMLHQFGRMLETGVGADVNFEVGGETFAAHRRLLAARSSVFMAQLFGPAKENDATCIQINDMEAKVFKTMLQYIYTETLPSIDDREIMEMAQNLFVAADRYNLERLKLICTNMLRNRIDTITVATMFAFAEQHGCDRLKKACFKFLASSKYLKTAAASDTFEHLKTINPNILEELILAQD